MKTFKVVKRRTEILSKEIEAENEMHALRLFREEATAIDREWENDSTVIVELKE